MQEQRQASAILLGQQQHLVFEALVYSQSGLYSVSGSRHGARHIACPAR